MYIQVCVDIHTFTFIFMLVLTCSCLCTCTRRVTQEVYLHSLCASSLCRFSKDLFGRIDANNDGVVSREEFERAMAMQADTPSPAGG